MERMHANGEFDEFIKPPMEEEAAGGPPKDIGADEDFMFEKYLKSGEYLDITKRKRQWRDSEDEEQELLEGLLFKDEKRPRLE